MSVVKGNFLRKNEAKIPVPLGGSQKREREEQIAKNKLRWNYKPLVGKQSKSGKGGQKPIIQLAVMPTGGGPQKGPPKGGQGQGRGRGGHGGHGRR